MLNYNDGSFNAPSIDLDLGSAVTPDNINDLTQPVANQNGSGGFSFNDALNGVLNLFNKGVEVYKSVDDVIGGAASQNAQAVQTATPTRIYLPQQPSVVFGLSTNQLLLIAAGLAAVVILPRLAKGRA